MGDPPVSWQIVERSTGPGGYRYLSGVYCSYICLGAALQAPAESPWTTPAGTGATARWEVPLWCLQGPLV